ncbi:hypothetical protein CEUSTIGMA_g5614.t1 [Chlamydomonas eustigma]|uniref:Uncharacterized protein n=1 Tax=Chlamydomonas eustigma TaxID=1157962 RepID=A0A250X5K0_9CHLO|nr:hypothetical protein CEUSTIGMA_g5614.t1 [Chlamydomonas eustigma]|eukprot:GAX78172.1 hypothetical protein CEUSTIGMA_g5614.t1 [Chlamydomonas eustigma]
MDNFVAKADRAFVEEDYETAIELYSKALGESPNSSTIYEARAHAHIKIEDYLSAVDDAAKAIEIDPSFSKAYLRSGVALFHMDEFEAALTAFLEGSQLDPENKLFKTWIRKCTAEFEDESRGDSNAQPQQTATRSAHTPSAAPGSSSAPAPATTSSTVDLTKPMSPSAVPEFEGKYRHQYYQLQSKVNVDVYAKNISREKVSCQFKESHLTFIIFDVDGNEEYKLDVELYGKINPEASRFEVLKTKIEICMMKADALQWGSLEKSSKVAAPNYSTPGTTAPAKYPSSFAPKAPKDWDKVESEISEMEKKGELEDGDPLNGFFKKIFSQGDEDTRRAMMKSFVESNGTVLSTNWADIGSKKVECTPPDGMEVKKFEI